MFRYASLSLIWEAKGRSRGRNASPQLQGQEVWKLQNSTRTSVFQAVHACSGWILPSVKPHILAVVFTAVFHCTTEGPRAAAFLPRFLKGAISPLVYRHAYFCFSALSRSLLFLSRPQLLTSLNTCLLFPCLSFPLDQILSFTARTPMWMACLMVRNWFSVLVLD